MKSDSSRPAWFTRLTPLALHTLFFLSGASGLGLQIAWTRMFALGLGHEMPAILAVVGATFIGLTAGAWISQHLVSGRRHPGWIYGSLELLIGAWGIVTIFLVPPGNQSALQLIGLQPSPLRQWLVSLLVPAAVLLPATLAMGATFAAMERFAALLSKDGRTVGGLYAANTVGAVFGIGLCMGWALPSGGFARTVAGCSALNLFCGLIALLLIKQVPIAPERACRETPREAERRALSWTLAATGLLGIGYEVLGVRVLAEVLENTVYTYAALLGVYLLGTAIGGAFYQSFGRRWTSPAARSAWFTGLALATVQGVAALTLAPSIYDSVRMASVSQTVGFWLADAVTASAVFLLPTIGMGIVFSYLVQRAAQTSINVGTALACNTAGSAAAPLLFGVLLFPLLGPKGCFVLLAWSYAVLAWPRTLSSRIAALLAIGLAPLLPNDFRFVNVRPGEKLLAYEAGPTDSIAVIEHPDRNRSLMVNNRFVMGGTGAASAERRHGALPILLHPSPTNALFLGLGTGITFASAARYGISQADGVELVPEVVKAMRWFEPENALPPGGERYKVWVADARRFIQVCPKTYDVIVADLFHPARDGAGALYSSEHYEMMRRHLAPQGIVCQWLPLFQLDERMVQVIVATFLKTFPEASAFLLRFNVDTPVLGLIGGLKPERFGPDYFTQRARDPAVLDHLAAEQIRDIFQLLGCFVAGPEALRTFSQGAEINTDDHPVVMFGAARFNWVGTAKPYGRLLPFLDLSSDIQDWLQLAPGDSFAEAMRDFIAARNVYLRGAIADFEGKPADAVAQYLESARRSSHFNTGYAQCLTLAVQKSKSDPQEAQRLLQELEKSRPERPVARQLLNRLFP